MSNTPDEKQLEKLLGGLQPQPTQRLSQKLGNAEWNQHQPRRLELRYLRNAVAAILLLIVLVWTIPPLRALAQEIIDAILVKADEDTRQLLITSEADWEEQIHQYYDYMTTEGNSPTFFRINSVDAAEARVGFDIIEPILPRCTQKLILGYVWLPGYNYWRGVITQDTVVTLMYDNSCLGMIISQAQVDLANESWRENNGLLVGASAQIETLDIGGTTVEHVHGEWISDETRQVLVWDNEFPLERFVWWQDGFLITIRTGNDLPTAMADMAEAYLIAVVESMILGESTTIPPVAQRESPNTTFVNSEDVVPDTVMSLSVDARSTTRDLNYLYTEYHRVSAYVAVNIESIDDAQATVLFDIIEPTGLPDGLELVDVAQVQPHYASVAQEIGVLQLYALPDAQYFVTIGQLWVDMETESAWWLDYGGIPVGASAQIERITIGNTTGQYVRGGWQRGENHTLVWDNSLAKQTLVWWQAGFLMSIVTNTIDAFTQADLLAIAESMILQGNVAAPEN